MVRPSGPLTRFELMTAISIFCGAKRRVPRVLGIWCHFGNCRQRAELGIVCEFRHVGSGLVGNSDGRTSGR